MGTGSPWPAADLYNRDGRVQLASRVEPLDGRAGVSAPVVGHELPHTVYPSERFEVPVVVRAWDARQVPLPPGRYRISIFLRQVGGEPFAERVRFVLEVTEGTSR
jgi:hypothetical protein